jgi:hypothetical protein
VRGGDNCDADAAPGAAVTTGVVVLVEFELLIFCLVGRGVVVFSAPLGISESDGVFEGVEVEVNVEVVVGGAVG